MVHSTASSLLHRSPALTFVLGARELYSSRYGSVPLYKAGARVDLGRGFSLHSRVSRNFRQPTMSELYLPYPVANPDLKPEYALNSDLGATLSRSTWRSRAQVTARKRGI